MRIRPLLACHPFLLAPGGERRALKAVIGAETRSAARSIDVSMLPFTSDRQVQALAERRRAGVNVRILLGRAQADDDFAPRLQAGGFEVRRVTPREPEARIHQKSAVLDAKLVVTGSNTWKVQGDFARHENVVLLRQEAAAWAFHEDFERTWQDKELSQQ
jgi:phosphatidylserine/phosphatidylglycerophosphate/cardiolipin synthase-like enzyme